MNARRAPQRIGKAHVADEAAQLARDSRRVRETSSANTSGILRGAIAPPYRV
jgi:hypothetical protein